MMKFYFFLIFCSIAVLSEGLECYYCVSTNSWSACNDGAKKVTCESYVDSCIKMYAQHTSNSHDEAYAKGCAKTCNKNDVPNCDNGVLDCKINCCSGDLCNAGSSMTASIPFTVLVTMALVVGRMI